MAKIVRVTQGSNNGKEGFIVVYKTQGPLSEIRAVGMTALRFPTTVLEAEVVGEQETADGSYHTRVFVPTEGFPSAGITNPIQWAREQFGDTFISDMDIEQMKEG